MEAIGRLLRTPARAPQHESVEAFLDAFASLEGEGGTPDSAPFVMKSLTRAMRGGALADRLGFAFVAGYSAALACLGAQSGAKRPLPLRASLAATERGGPQPRAIETTIAPDPRRPDMFVVDGVKTFATMGTLADVFLVAAAEGVGEDGRPRIRLVRVGARATGVTVEARPPTPFAPEVPHAIVRMAGVSVAGLDVLPGDGYARYLKPFRTIEDLHVLAATLTYLLRLARAERISTLAECVVAHLHTLAAIAMPPEGTPQAHVALAGVFASVRALLAEHHAALVALPDEVGARLARDLPLLAVAEVARAARTAAAWAALESGRGSVLPPAG